MSDGEILALDVDHFSGSGVITDKPAVIWGYMIDTDALNDVSIELFNVDRSKVIFPRVVWEATDKKPKKIMVKGRYSKEGLRLEAKTEGYFRLVPLYQNWTG